MAVNKTINKRTNTHGAMRNCIEYVLRQDKTSELLTYITGPYVTMKLIMIWCTEPFWKKRRCGIKIQGECMPTTLFPGIRMSRSPRSRHLNLEKSLQKIGSVDSRP